MVTPTSQKPILFLTILTLLIIILPTINSLDFHLKKTITLPNIHSNIRDIITIAPDTIAIQQGNLSQLTITLLTGLQYKTQLFKLTQKNLISQPKFNNTYSILLNKGNKVLIKSSIDSLQKYQNLSIAGNYITGYPYNQQLYFSSKNNCPTLNYYNFYYKRIQNYIYNNNSLCDFNYSGYLNIYNQRYIIYAAGYDLLEIDKYNQYKVNSQYHQNIHIYNNKYNNMDIYYNNNNKQLTILVQYYNRYNRILRKNGSQFIKYQQFYNNQLKMYLTGRNQAISLSGNKLYRWQALDNSTLKISQNKDQSLQLSKPSALSYNQSLFIQTKGNKIQVYQIDTNYTIIKNYQIQIKQQIIQILQGRITYNNKYYIFNAINDKKYITFCLFDFQSKNVSCLNSSRSMMDVGVIVQVQVSYQQNQYQERYNTGNMYNQKLNKQQDKQQQQQINKIKQQSNKINPNYFTYTPIDQLTYKQSIKNTNKKLQQNNNNNKQSQQNQAHNYNCTQWSIYSNPTYYNNRIISICKNTDTNIIQLHSYIIDSQTQTLSLKLQTIQDIYMNDLPQVYAIKLIKNQYKQQNDDSIRDRPIFLLIFKISQHEKDDNAITYFYQGSRQFIRGSQKSIDISFWNVYAYGRYIASLKTSYINNDNNNLKFFDFTSLQLIKQVPYQHSTQLGNYQLSGYRNIFTITKMYQNSIKTIYYYDLKKYPNQLNWYKGSIKLQIPTNTKQHYSIIFPKKQIQYNYRYDPTTQTQTNQPLQYIYSIQKLPIKQQIIMQQGVWFVQIHKYFKYQPLIKGRQCQLIFYISDNRYLHKYQDCITYKKTWKWDLNPNKQYYQVWRLYQSAQKQKIVIKYLHSIVINKTYTVKYQIIQVRQIYNPQQLIWKYNYTAGNRVQQFINYQQDMYGSTITIGKQTQLIYKNIQSTLNSSYLQMISIQNIQLQSQCFAFSGKTQQNLGKDTSIIFNVIRNNNNNNNNNYVSLQQLFNIRNIQQLQNLKMDSTGVINDTIKILRFSSNCLNLAVWTGKGYLIVWNTTQQYRATVIFNQTRDINKIKDFKFSGNDKIILETIDKIQIINIGNNVQQQLQQQQKQELYQIKTQILTNNINDNNNQLNAYTSKIATSKDGKIYALTISQLSVQIKTTNSTSQQLIRTFIIPIDSTTQNQQIISLSFDDNNQLYVTLTNGIIYVLTPSQCNNPYINVNGICLCRQNQTQVNNTCVCNKHYIQQKQECVCNLKEFIFENSECKCSVNASQVQGSCICHSNFIKNGAHCLCPQSFQFTADKFTCLCPYGYVDKNQCIGCSFPCSTCSAGGFNCDSYQAGFYILVIGGPILVIAIIVFVIYKIKNKSKATGELLKDDDDI